MEVSEDASANKLSGKFYLNKWYLDFTSEAGEAMIFYSAKLILNNWSASYTSWMNYEPASGVAVKSRFSDVPVPRLLGDSILFDDTVNSVSAIWKSSTGMITLRVSESTEGYLDWLCYQPASVVSMNHCGRTMTGRGYAEQIIATVPPWKINMSGLLWGRFVSDNYNLVWISLRRDEEENWLWLNGERTVGCLIENEHIGVPERQLELTLDSAVTLESERKILSVAARTLRFIPVLHKVMPFRFLTARGSKWLSRSELRIKDSVVAAGMSIHEYVNFNT